MSREIDGDDRFVLIGNAGVAGSIGSGVCDSEYGDGAYRLRPRCVPGAGRFAVRRAEFTLLLRRRAARWAGTRQYLLDSDYVAYHEQNCSAAVAMNAVRFCSIVLVAFGKRSSGRTTDNGASSLVRSNGLTGVSY